MPAPPAVAAEEERWHRTPQDAVEAQGQEAVRWSGSGQNKADGAEEAPPTWFRELFCQQLLSTKKGRGKSQHRGSRQDEMELLKYWEVAQLNKELRQQVTHLLEQHGHHLSLMQAQARAWQFASQRAVRALPFWFLARRMQQLPGPSHRRKSCVLSRRFSQSGGRFAGFWRRSRIWSSRSRVRRSWVGLCQPLQPGIVLDSVCLIWSKSRQPSQQHWQAAEAAAFIENLKEQQVSVAASESIVARVCASSGCCCRPRTCSMRRRSRPV